MYGMRLGRYCRKANIHHCQMYWQKVKSKTSCFASQIPNEYSSVSVLSKATPLKGMPKRKCLNDNTRRGAFRINSRLVSSELSYGFGCRWSYLLCLFPPPFNKTLTATEIRVCFLIRCFIESECEQILELANNIRGSSVWSAQTQLRTVLNHPRNPYLKALLVSILVTNSSSTVKPQNLEAPNRKAWADSTFFPSETGAD